MRRHVLPIIVICAFAYGIVPEGRSESPAMDYLGQPPPGDVAQIFAPGVVSTAAMEFRLVISPKGDDIFFCREATLKRLWRKPDGSGWEGPATPAFCGENINGESWFSADGAKLYFCSRRPMPHAKAPINVWVTEKIDGDWKPAKPLGSPITDQTAHAISVSQNGTMYASGIIRFRMDSGNYLPAEPLRPPIEGHHPCIAADESFLIFGQRRESGLDPDLYIIFRKSDGSWTERINLGDRVNTEKSEGNASLSPDGKYLFFSRNADIYWVSAAFIDTLKIRALSK